MVKAKVKDFYSNMVKKVKSDSYGGKGKERSNSREPKKSPFGFTRKTL